MHKERVPVASVLGTDKLSAKAAVLLKQATDKALADGVIEKKDLSKLLEVMVKRFLAT